MQKAKTYLVEVQVVIKEEVSSYSTKSVAERKESVSRVMTLSEMRDYILDMTLATKDNIYGQLDAVEKILAAQEELEAAKAAEAPVV